MQQRIIFIVGPTGVGKSALGLALARKFNGAIVSCDAMQVYREVNIACDKPSHEARATVPHFMVDAASVTEEYNVAQYAKAANIAIETVLKEDKVPIVVGGSGMYVSVLLDGIFDAVYKDEALRERLLLQEPLKLHQELAAKDPQAAGKIHPHDLRRLVRALEVFQVAGRPISELQQNRTGLWGKYAITIVGLYRERSVLYAMAEERIDRMFAQGLVEEARSVCALPLSRTAKTVIGIPEVQGYLNGEYDLERAKYLMKLNTRHYVKRQLTWFRRDKRIEWIDIDGESMEHIVERIL